MSRGVDRRSSTGETAGPSVWRSCPTGGSSPRGPGTTAAPPGRSGGRTPDGRLIATGSGYHGDSTVTLWDATTHRRIHVLKGHVMTVWGLAFSPDGTRLASASDDQTVKVWDVTSGRDVLTLRGHSQGVVG